MNVLRGKDPTWERAKPSTKNCKKRAWNLEKETIRISIGQDNKKVGDPRQETKVDIRQSNKGAYDLAAAGAGIKQGNKKVRDPR